MGCDDVEFAVGIVECIVFDFVGLVEVVIIFVDKDGPHVFDADGV